MQGVIAQDALEVEVLPKIYNNAKPQRKMIDVVSRMIAAIPSDTDEKKDRLASMLAGIANAYLIYGCKETELIGWQGVVAALMQRHQLWAEADVPAPDWFKTVCAIFRGEC